MSRAQNRCHSTTNLGRAGADVPKKSTRVDFYINVFRLADRNDHVQVEVIELPLDIPFTLPPNRQDFLVSCLMKQFAFFKDAENVLADILLAGLKQLRHKRLRQDGLVFQPHLDLHLPVLGLIDEKLAFLR